MNRSLGIAVTVIAMLSALPAQQRAASSEATLRLGMTFEEVRGALGDPAGCYSRLDQKTFWGSDCESARPIYSAIDDVYTRTTATNEFHIRVKYGLDRSRSRLKPDLRVQYLTFVVDRPAPASQFVSEIPELAALCNPRCSVVGSWTSQTPSLHFYVANPNNDQGALATAIATGWEEPSMDIHWTLAIRAELDKERNYAMRLSGKPQTIDWLNEKCISLTLTAFSEESHRDSVRYSGGAHSLGYWPK